KQSALLRFMLISVHSWFVPSVLLPIGYFAIRYWIRLLPIPRDCIIPAQGCDARPPCVATLGKASVNSANPESGCIIPDLAPCVAHRAVASREGGFRFQISILQSHTSFFGLPSI